MHELFKKIKESRILHIIVHILVPSSYQYGMNRIIQEDSNR